MGLKLDSGVELLIHVGMDTVEMNGDGFTRYAEEGARVKKGDKLVGFDIAKIKEAGHDTTVAVVVSNTDDFAAVTGVPASHADLTKNVILVKR